MSTVQERVQSISNNKDLNLNTPYTTAKIELTGICTLKCNFCYNKIMKDKHIRQKNMNLSDLCFVIDKLKEIPTLKEVGLFYMGESGLNYNIISGYRLLKSAGYFTYLTTNATNIKYIKLAIPYIDSLKVSWNYKNDQDFITKTNTDVSMYSKIIENIETLYKICHQNNKELTISTVLDSDEKEYNEVLKSLKFDHHYFIPLQTQGGTNINGYDGVIGESKKPSNPIPCWSLFKGIYIDVDLNVRTCCYGHQDKHIIGNLKNSSLLDLINSKKVIDMKKKHLNNEIPIECLKCLKNQMLLDKNKIDHNCH